ncbi:MAG: PfkB family carbohydrate kinase [Myxococcales bacterium]|nr:PfkB family carbohydrate kinase [Myxococcales bacterium]
MDLDSRGRGRTGSSVTRAADTTRLDVVGIGSMVLDRVHRVARILGREEKGILRAVGNRGPVAEHVGGVVLNQLGWAAALGLRAGICGRQAADRSGRVLRAAMDRAGITRDITLEGSASSFAEIFVDDAGERAIYMAPGATSETTAAHVRRDHADFIRRAARLVTEISQLPLDAVREALRIARAAGIATAVDLDVSPGDAVPGLGDERTLDEVLRAADLLKPARRAAQQLAPEAGEDPLALARCVRARFANRAVVVTDGAAGCAIAAEDFEGFVPATPVKAVDTTGAGDAFLGGLLAALHHGLPWESAARLANSCGAACAERMGAFPDDLHAARARALALYAGPALPLAPLAQAAPAPLAGAPGAAALATLDVVLEELAALRARLGSDAFDAALALIRDARAAGARVHVTGVGKPEHVAHYAASLLSSTGVPATFLHATEAVHGSAGQLVSGDVLIAISNSGETSELRAVVEAARVMGARILGVSGAPDAWLASHADAFLDAGVQREGGALGLAPRASAAAELVVLAALSAALESELGLTRAEYHRRHPAGALGRRSRDA